MPSPVLARQEEVDDAITAVQVGLKDPPCRHPPGQRQLRIALLHVAEPGRDLDEHAANVQRQVAFDRTNPLRPLA